MPYMFRKPTGSPADRGAAPPRQRREAGPDGMIIERDVPVPARGGVTVYADVFRPADGGPAPALIAWSPYGKHAGPQLPERYPDGGVASGQLSEYTAFESPDPVHWTARGYAVVNADIPGTWYSGGDATFLSPEEAWHGHDLIEWAGTRGWSNGRVGMSGVSYLASSQWTIAGTRPPHLAAINPWEGWSDTYREVARHGGIPETYFWPYIGQRWGYGTGRVEDLAAETAAHPFFDEFWAGKAADLSRITVPAYVVASWSDQGLHTRGTFEGFARIASERKWLDAHGGKKWGYYYSEEGLRRQQEFFDHFLKGLPTGVTEWPRVRYEIRDRGHPAAGTRKTGEDWPLPGTSYVPLYLDAGAGTLDRSRPPAAASVSYDSERAGRGRGRAVFDFRFGSPAELAGGMKLRTWMSAPDATDMDVFVAVQKLDGYGDLTGFPFYAVFTDGPVALGWLRASHRELDPALSSPWQPVLAHRRALPLKPGEPVPLEIEILPSGTLFRAGETLRLVIQGRDIYRYPRPLIQALHDDSVNRGPHVIHAGGEFDSHLLVPVAPGSRL
ncbi:MAG: CocE/NonD family hydrolase [Streptosporangiaceae bacterium]|nr:CocE/NonD family hydrolase [Streptosporangiaceae bacterium]